MGGEAEREEYRGKKDRAEERWEEVEMERDGPELGAQSYNQPAKREGVGAVFPQVPWNEGGFISPGTAAQPLI